MRGMLEEESENGVLRYFLRYFFSSMFYYYYYFHGMVHRLGLKRKKITKYYLFIDELLMLFIVIVPEKYI